jgi:hypothetical protein
MTAVPVDRVVPELTRTIFIRSVRDYLDGLAEDVSVERAAVAIRRALHVPAPEDAIEDYLWESEHAQAIEDDPRGYYSRVVEAEGGGFWSGGESWALDRATEHRQSAQAALERIVG